MPSEKPYPSAVDHKRQGKDKSPKNYVAFKFVVANRVKTLYFRLGSCIFPRVPQKGFSEQNFAVNLLGVAP
jgi:hypothetical protein